MIATSAGFLVAGVAKILGLADYWEYGLFGFFSTFCVYNGQRLFTANATVKTSALNWTAKHRLLILVLSIVSGLLATYFFFKVLNDVTVALVILMGVAVPLSFFYVVPIGGKNIRERAHLKVHAIALTWTGIIGGFPVVNESIDNWAVLVLFFPVLYFYFSAVAIAFDIRDLKYDLQTLRTIPQVMGVQRAKIVAISLLVITMVGIGLFSTYYFVHPIFAIAILIQIFLIASIRKEHPDTYYTVFIDGAVSLLGISFLIS